MDYKTDYDIKKIVGEDKYYWDVVSSVYKRLGRERDEELIKAISMELLKKDKELAETAKIWLDGGKPL